VQNNITSNIDRYYRKITLNSLQASDSQDIIEKYYRELEKIRRERRENPKKIASLTITQFSIDNNNAVFSFSFGTSLLDSFIKVEFEPIFGLSLLDSFIF